MVFVDKVAEDRTSDDVHVPVIGVGLLGSWRTESPAAVRSLGVVVPGVVGEYMS